MGTFRLKAETIIKEEFFNEKKKNSSKKKLFESGLTFSI